MTMTDFQYDTRASGTLLPWKYLQRRFVFLDPLDGAVMLGPCPECGNPTLRNKQDGTWGCTISACVFGKPSSDRRRQPDWWFTNLWIRPSARRASARRAHAWVATHEEHWGLRAYGATPEKAALAFFARVDKDAEIERARDRRVLGDLPSYPSVAQYEETILRMGAELSEQAREIAALRKQNTKLDAQLDTIGRNLSPEARRDLADRLHEQIRGLAEARLSSVVDAGAGEVEDPIPLILECPGCGDRHIDRGQWATKPHHTHACQTCGVCWRPAVVCTVGVQFLPGFKDASP